MTKLERKISPIDDDGAKMHGSLANSVLAPWESTVNSHESLMSKSDIIINTFDMIRHNEIVDNGMIQSLLWNMCAVQNAVIICIKIIYITT